MAKLNYQSAQPKRSKSSSSSNSLQLNEVIGPIILIALGLIIFGWTLRGAGSVMFIMGIVIVICTVQTIVGVVAAFITASIMSASFGELRTAVVKLAGIIIFCGALSAIIPYGGWIVFFIYLGLLMLMFGLEKLEAVVFALIFAVMRVVISIAVMGMLK